MHPDMMFELAKFHIEELHKEAAGHRLAKDRSRITAVRRGPNFWARIGFRKLRSKTA